jgi:hypothetical protein
MATKVDHASPGLFTILLSVVLGVSLGSLLAVVHLVARPVEVVRAIPKEAAIGVRYALEGVSGSAAGARWKVKVQRLADKMPGEYAFVDAELNAWAGSTFKKAEPPKGEAPSFALLTGVPNFRLDGGIMQIVTVNDLLVLGGLGKVVVEARGAFEKESDGWHFSPSELYFGGFPAHKMPVLASLLVNRLGVSSMVPVEAGNVLARASSIEVTGGSLVVNMP